MGNENGTWVMYGVEPDDPECIHTVNEAIEYINDIGFLPLFKNETPGFSLEERTVSERRWSEDPSESAKRIKDYMADVYPIATPAQIKKVIGV